MTTKTSAVTVVTGASGLIGSALSDQRVITPLLRRPPVEGEPWWEPLEGRVHNLPPNTTVAVHLAGENIASGRWSQRRKDRIRDSRLLGTRTLVDALLAQATPPDVLVMSSGISFYGSQGDTELSEESQPGTGFLAQLSQDWEAEGLRAQAGGIRVVQLRLGMVLSPRGGALAKMLPAFRAGLGGPMGGGQNWSPWIHIEDVIRMIEWAIAHSHVEGAYNLVAPEAVRQRDFAATLGKVLRRPAVVPAPAFALRLALGDMADEALLASHRAKPKRLTEEGFEFRWSSLEAALSDLLSR